MKVFVDNDIAPSVARAVHQAVLTSGDTAVALRDKFAQDAKDIEWIKKLENEGGWVVVSADKRITRNKIERDAFRSTNLIGFFLAPGWSKITIIEQTARLLLWWPRLKVQTNLVRGGSAFELPINAGSKLKSLPL